MPTPQYSPTRATKRAAEEQDLLRSKCHLTGGAPDGSQHAVLPAKRDGPDAPNNMQWQTKEAAKAKDKVE